MSLTQEERIWLRKHIQTRQAEQAVELAALGKQKAVTGLADKDKTALGEHFVQTGRAGADTTAAEQLARAQKKDAHLSDALEKVEEGINTRRIEDQEARRVDPGTRRVAQETAGAQFDAQRVADARAALDDQQARRDIALHAIDAQITARLLADHAGATLKDLSKDAAHKVMREAIEHVAKAKGLVMPGAEREAYLAHFASRHGSKTTLDQQIARPITGVPADLRDDTLAPTTVTLHDGSTAQVPLYAQFGKFDDVSSRLASGAAGLAMLEESLVKARELERFDRVADSFAVDLLTTDAQGFGEGVAKAPVAPVSPYGYNAYFNTSPGAAATLAGLSMEDRFKGRARFLQKELNIKGAKIVLDRALEGGYVPKTMFPDRRVENAARERITTGPNDMRIDEVATQFEQDQRDKAQTTAQTALNAAQALGGKLHEDPQAGEAAVVASQLLLDQAIAAVPGDAKQAALKTLAAAAAELHTVQAQKAAWDAAASKVATAETAARIALDARNLAKPAYETALGLYRTANTQPHNRAKMDRQAELLTAERTLEAEFKVLDAARAEQDTLRPFIAEPASLAALLSQRELARNQALAQAKAVVGDLPVLNHVSTAAVTTQETRLTENGLATAAREQAQAKAAQQDAALRHKIEAHSPGDKGRDEMHQHAAATLQLGTAAKALAKVEDAETLLTQLQAGRPTSEQAAAAKLALYNTALANVQAAPGDLPKHKLLIEARRNLAVADNKLAQEMALEAQVTEFLADPARPPKAKLLLAKTEAAARLQATGDAVKMQLQPAKPGDPVPDTTAILADIETAAQAKAGADAVAQTADARARGARAMAEVAGETAQAATAQADAGRKLFQKAKQKALALGVAGGGLPPAATDAEVYAYMNDKLPPAERAVMEAELAAEASDAQVAQARTKQQAVLTEAAKPLASDVAGSAAARIEAAASQQKAEIEAFASFMQQELADRSAQMQQHAAAADLKLKAVSDGQATLDAAHKVVSDAKSHAQTQQQRHADAQVQRKARDKELGALKTLEEEAQRRRDDTSANLKARRKVVDDLQAGPGVQAQKILDEADAKNIAANKAGEQASTLEAAARTLAKTADTEADTATARETEARAAGQARDALSKKPSDAAEQGFDAARQLEQQATALAAARASMEKDIMLAQALAAQATRDYEPLRDKAGAATRLAAAREQLAAAQAGIAQLDTKGQAAKTKEIEGLQQRLIKLAADAELPGDASAPALEALRVQIAEQEQLAQSLAERLEAAGEAARDAQASATTARLAAETLHSDELHQAELLLEKTGTTAAEARSAADKTRKASEAKAGDAKAIRAQQTQHESAAKTLRDDAAKAQAQALKDAEAEAIAAQDQDTAQADAVKTAAGDVQTKQQEVEAADQLAADALAASDQAALDAQTTEATQKAAIDKASAELRSATKQAEESERVRKRVQDETVDERALADANIARAHADHAQRLADTLKTASDPRSIAQAELAAQQVALAQVKVAIAETGRLWHLAGHDQVAADAARRQAGTLHDNAKVQVDAWLLTGKPLTDVQAALQAHLPKLAKSRDEAQLRLDRTVALATQTEAATTLAQAKLEPAQKAVATAEAALAKLPQPGTV